MFVHLFNTDSLDRVAVTHDVNGAICAAKSDRSVALPFTFERMVPKPRNRSCDLKAVHTHEVNP